MTTLQLLYFLVLFGSRGLAPRRALSVRVGGRQAESGLAIA